MYIFSGILNDASILYDLEGVEDGKYIILESLPERPGENYELKANIERGEVWWEKRPEPEPEPPSELEQLKQQNKQLMSAARVFCATATTIADDAALQMPDLFPVWEDVLETGKKLEEGTILQDSGTLYRVVQSGGVVPQEGQPPHGAGMLAVYRPIDQKHAGTEDDPIPWGYGMDCKAGQYFSYEGHVYKVAEGGDMIPCIWAPGTPGLWQWELVK